MPDSAGKVRFMELYISRLSFRIRREDQFSLLDFQLSNSDQFNTLLKTILNAFLIENKKLNKLILLNFYFGLGICNTSIQFITFINELV